MLKFDQQYKDLVQYITRQNCLIFLQCGYSLPQMLICQTRKRKHPAFWTPL